MKYFVKVASSKDNQFIDYCIKQRIKGQHISSEWNESILGYMYSIDMDEQEALRMKLSISVMGIMKQPSYKETA